MDLLPMEKAQLSVLTVDGAAVPAGTAISWNSSGPCVKVDEHGAIQTVGIGDAVITAAYNGCSNQCSVHVVESQDRSSVLSSERQEYVIGETVYLYAGISCWSDDLKDRKVIDCLGRFPLNLSDESVFRRTGPTNTLTAENPGVCDAFLNCPHVVLISTGQLVEEYADRHQIGFRTGKYE